MPVIIFARIAVKEGEAAAIERYAHRMGAKATDMLESAFREGVEILLERIEESDLRRPKGNEPGP